MQIIVEGWRFVPHSYSIVNQFQCLELLQRPEIKIFHRDVPYYGKHWRPVTGLWDTASEHAIATLPTPLADQAADITLRIAYPHDFLPSPASRLCVFCTSELGLVKRVAIAQGVSLAEAQQQANAVIITPSQWSRQGVIRSGANPARTVVVPHGADPGWFHPLSPEERTALRTRLGWEGFVFLNVGGMGGNKGIPLLLKACAVLADYYPDIRLALKGLDSLYASGQLFQEMAKTLSDREVAVLQERLLYIGETLSLAEMAELYQAADAYVSPYLAEGFNLPVLEAIACGLPVICTAGGSTDDFTQPDFALRIASQRQELEAEPGTMGYMLVPDLHHLLTLMQTVIEDTDFTTRARQTGYPFVAEHFTWKHVCDRLLKVLRDSEADFSNAL